ncbi:aminoglycoside phosphotransferase family protein [Clostridium sp. YIM B02515]|uniref:Aminoglycoside phosphotransferase family protein n=1 Tax=Clostridium rhizosphaerae TaxID=2803861 RepID=A0ABS1TG58_9CLOT|nr:aminoglycoside phosphotransferase family protein [Clostridium rhizosphaerae]MBL4937762.1 aminoglycoside phosphotransferase family protein [Clostridium rhizosphaerae]
MSQNNERLFNFESVDTEVIHTIFSKYNNRLLIQNIVPITDGMSTSNYMVEANNKKYLLKVYPKNNDHSDIEIAAYKHAHYIIKVPEILHFDNSKTIIDNTYAIFQYIDGLTLREYVAKNRGFTNNIAYKIGSMLALLHRKEYDCTALLDDDLCIKKQVTQFENQYEFFLAGMPGKHLNEKLKRDLEHFIDDNRHLIERISKKNVFCHGDFIPSNILIDVHDTPWFIDFEYCFSAPCYYDIGKLFRTRENYSEYIDDKMKRDFAEGYNVMSYRTLPENWHKLGKIADIVVMLALINRENIPRDWIEGIEEEIIVTMNMQ